MLTAIQSPETLKFFGGKVYSPKVDVFTVFNETIIRQKEIEVAYSREAIPGINQMDGETALLLRPNGRSSKAQSGLQVKVRPTIEKLSRDLPQMREQINAGRVAISTAVVENWSNRPLIIPEGTGIFKLFCAEAAKVLENGELREAVSSGRIKITGDEGKDWGFVNHLQDAVRINLKINQQSFQYYSSEEELPAIEVAEGKNYRNQIDERMTKLSLKMPKPEERVMWVCESESRLTIADSDVFALVPDWVASSALGNGDLRLRVPHASANALFPNGETEDWPIRFEFLALLAELPECVELTFVANRE